MLKPAILDLVEFWLQSMLSIKQARHRQRVLLQSAIPESDWRRMLTLLDGWWGNSLPLLPRVPPTRWAEYPRQRVYSNKVVRKLLRLKAVRSPSCAVLTAEFQIR